MKRWIKAIALALTAALLISLCGFSGECAGIRERVVRLHVLANSDSQADQELKLKVRDAVVEAAAGLFDEAADAGDALTLAQEKLPELPEFVALEDFCMPGYSVAQVNRVKYSAQRPLTGSPKIPEPYHTFTDTFSYGI